MACTFYDKEMLNSMQIFLQAALQHATSFRQSLTSGCSQVPLTDRVALSQIRTLPSMLAVAATGRTDDSATASMESV